MNDHAAPTRELFIKPGAIRKPFGWKLSAIEWEDDVVARPWPMLLLLGDPCEVALPTVGKLRAACLLLDIPWNDPERLT